MIIKKIKSQKSPTLVGTVGDFENCMVSRKAPTAVVSCFS